MPQLCFPAILANETVVKQWAEPTWPLGLVLAAYFGQGSPATVSKAEIEAVCTAYVTAHTCFGGLLRPGRGLFWQQGQRPCSGLFWRCLPRRATALVEEPSEVTAEGFRVVRV